MLTAALAAVGLGISAYLSYSRYTHSALVCTTGGCEKVQSSSYAEVAGVPVAVLGLVGYVLILVSTFVAGEVGRAAGAALAACGLAFSLYLLVVQLAVIDAVCLWCVANDAVILAVAVTTALRLRLAARSAVPA
jgi:uncharacterized membrane protein